MTSARTALAFGLLATLALGCAGAETAKLERPGRGSIGEELYGVLCDRIGAQALPEDLYGLSFVDGCHRDSAGQFADRVDTDPSLLPELVDGARNLDGAAVPLADQQEHRRRMIARVEALFAHRADLVRAFDAIFPGDLQIIAKDLANPDEAKSCDVPAASSTVRLGDALEDYLSRIVPMYDDGTLPNGTRSLARVFEALNEASKAHEVFARIQGREQYRPIPVAVGLARPLAAYPRLRELANAGLSLFSPEVKLADGTVLYPAGKGAPTLQATMAALYQELRTATAEAPEPPLASTADTASARDVLSRPRTKSELLREVLTFEDARLGGTTSSFIAARDRRGFVALNGPVAAPFVDRDSDGLPDVNAQGSFVTTDGKAAPAPFYLTKPSDRPVDANLRPLKAPGGALVYAYVDTKHTIAAEVTSTLRPLVEASAPGQPTALWDALGGVKVIAGARVKRTKTYAADPQLAKDWAKTRPGEAPPADLTTAPVRLTYDSIDPAKSPILDVVHALTYVLGDENADDVLHLAQALLAKHPNAVARVAKALMEAREAVARHPEAKLPASSMFWDELLDVVAGIVDPPDGRADQLPEKMIDALTDSETAKLGGIYANYMRYRDELTYDRANINGQAYNVTDGRVIEMRNDVDRTQLDTGRNRSSFQRFLQLIHDTNGVAACNKQGATIYVPTGTLGFAQVVALTLPPSAAFGGSYDECAVFKIDNMAQFYVDAMVGKAEMYLRDSTLRQGILGIGAANVDLMTKLSNIQGFYAADGITVLPNDSSERTLRPTPKFLDRLVFFDTPGDTQNPRTQRFMRDLIGDNGFGSAVCRERAPLTDPLPNAPDAAPDGRIRGLRSCDTPDLLKNRSPNTIFVWERFGFFGAMRPLLKGFVEERRQARFLDLLEVMHAHWQSSAGAATTSGAAECLLSRVSGATCTGDGISSYEPLLIEILNGDTLPALVELQKAAKALSLSRCTEYDTATRQCKPGKTVTKSGTAVLASALRSLASPSRARALGVKYRDGSDKALRNDGTRTRQVTPLDLLVDGLKGFDAAFAASGDPKRLEGWRRARSVFADQAFKTTGTGAGTTFDSTLLPIAGPRMIAILREQLAAHCPPPSGTANPKPLCTWATTEMPKSIEDLLTSPLAASLLDVGEVVRTDAAAKAELDALVRYLLDPTSPHDALASLLAAVTDFAQVLGDDANLVPLLHLASSAAAPTLRNARGEVVLPSVADGQLALLRRMAAQVFVDGQEVCSREMDPLNLTSGILERLVTPMKRADGAIDRTPFEIIADAIADVNRVDASRRDPLEAPDYGKLSFEVYDFITNEKRGLEQFYAIVKKGLR